MNKASVAAVIPIRMSDVCFPDGTPRVFLQGRPLWCYTIEAVLSNTSLQRIIVASDDERFYSHLEEYPRLEHPVVRPPQLSTADMTTLDVLAHVSGQLGEAGYTPDYYMMLEITHPMRPEAIIDRLIDIVSTNEYDSIFTAYVGTYNYWYKTEEEKFSRVEVKTGHARSPMYQEMLGLASLFRPMFLKTTDPYGERVGIIPISRLEGLIDARDEDGLWLAEQFLSRRSAVIPPN